MSLLPYADQVQCPRATPGREHRSNMEWELREGVRTGKLLAWCHTCRALVDDLGTRAIRISDEERMPERRVNEGGRRREKIERNNAIFDAWKANTTQIEIGRVFGIGQERVSQIVRKRRSA